MWRYIKILKKDHRLNYIYYGNLEQFKAKYNGKNDSFIADNSSYKDLMVLIHNDKIKIGVERGGHSGGNWYYLADINANKEETHFTGYIDFIEYRERTKSKKYGEMVGLIILSIMLLPITLILLLIALIKNLIFQSNEKRRIDLLNNFMVDYMGCQSDNFKHHKRLPNIPYEERIKLLKYIGLSSETVHLYFSGDFMKRIEVYVNNVGSYSYSMESLTLFEGEELFWASMYGYWTSVDTSNSYFENLHSLLDEIKIELAHFEEDLLFKTLK